MIRRRARRLVLPLAACVLALGAVSPPATGAPADPALLLLRLPDLGPGYEHVDFPNPSCELSLQGADHGCGVSFQQLWTIPGESAGPAYVESAAFTFATPERAHAAFGRPRDIAASLFMFSAPHLSLVEPAPAVGDEAILMQTGRAERSLAVWRSGSVVGVVIASAPYRGGPSSAQAVQLAGAQQARIATPAPLLPADFDDIEVLLDNPRLDVPVYWLGRSFTKQGRLPALRLIDVTPAENFEMRSGSRLDMTYGGSRGEATVTVGLQRPRPLADRRSLRQLVHFPCAGSERIPLRDGHATLIRPVRGCKEGWPSPIPAIAIASLPGVTAVVALGADEETCAHCYGPVARYARRAGMHRLLHALHLREHRAFTP